MAKTNAEKQDYRERKKLVIDEFLEKERKRQKKYYVKKNPNFMAPFYGWD